MKDAHFETSAGIVQAIVFPPLSMLAIGAAGLVAVALGGAAIAGELGGPSLDLERWAYDPDLLPRPDRLEAGLNSLMLFLLEVLPAWWLYLATWIQNVALLLPAIVLAVLTVAARRRWTDTGETWSRGLGRTFATKRVDLRWWALGALGGLTVSWLPGVVLQLLNERLQLDNTTTEMLVSSVQRSAGWEIIFGFLTVAIFVPLFEEFLIRGYVWSVFERWTPALLPFVLTTLGFAMLHGSPLHVLGVLPIALWLGWLRWQSGSLWPGVATHVVNNAMAMSLATFAADASLPFGLELGIGLVTGAISIWLVVLAHRWPSAPVDDPQTAS